MRFPAHLHTCTYAHISSWMTAKRLTLNSAKTEFLFIGLKQKLGKIHNTLLNTETQQNQSNIKKNIEHDISACRGGLRGLFFLIIGMRVIPRRNHPCQISSRSVKGFGGYGLRVPKIGCCVVLPWSTLQQLPWYTVTSAWIDSHCPAVPSCKCIAQLLYY